MRARRVGPAGFLKRGVGAAAIAVLVSALITATPAVAATGAPKPALGKPVPGHHANSAASASSAPSSKSVKPDLTSLPKAGTYTVATKPDGHRTALKFAGKRFGDLLGAWQPVGATGIELAPADVGSHSGASTSVKSVTAQVLSASQAKKFGLSGLVIQLQRSDSAHSQATTAIRIPATLLNSLFGADYASRVHWTELPATKASSSPKGNALSSSADPSTKSVVTAAQVSATPMLLAATAAPSSTAGTGTFTATSLKPSDTWDVSAQTGDFSWTYPLRVPPVAAGPAPDLSLSYDSQSVDGETASTNNQPSSVGDGWHVTGSGFIERTYVPCALDDGSSGPVTSSGDLCWKTDNATLDLNGHAGQLVQIGTSGTWRLLHDDGTRIQHTSGASCGSNGTYDSDCWTVTTTDGTRYLFGANPSSNSTWTVPVFGNDPGEPCHAATFAASSCAQGWRWNLDEVIDTNGNAETFTYNAQTNEYALNGTTATTYVRGGELASIQYGAPSSSIHTTNAPSQVVSFGYDSYGRCSDSTHANCTTEPSSGAAVTPAVPASYPDIPYDQNCTTGTCSTQLSPTFWSNSMLDTITTSVWSGTAYSTVDTWTLGHSFPDPGDSSSAALWLTSITHTGYVGSTTGLSEPATTFTGRTLQNRVYAIDGELPLNRYRISGITSALGAKTTVGYSSPQCTAAQASGIEANPWSNTELCFPEWWTPQGGTQREDLFNKYVINDVVSNPTTGGSNDVIQQSTYTYGTPGWRYDTSPLIPDAQRTWSVFAGFNSVNILTGDPTIPAQEHENDYVYYQGLDQDRANASGGTKTVYVAGTTIQDSLWFAGRVYSQKTLNGAAGPQLSQTIHTPWVSAATATDASGTAYLTGDAKTVVTTPNSTGTATTTTNTTYDPTYGFATQVDTEHSDGATNTCRTITATTPNLAAWIIGATAESVTVGQKCGTTPNFPADAISDTRTYYDGSSTLGAAPTIGNVTSTQVATSYTNGAPQFTTASTTTVDSLGRPLAQTDILGHTTTTTYTPAAGASHAAAVTARSVVNNSAPVSWTTSTQYNPALGLETSATDQNGLVTSASYDALGRRTGVWLPGNPQSTNPTNPNTAYTYALSQTAASSVETTTWTSNSTLSSYTLYDGLGRAVQTQSLSPAGGTIVTDTGYDANGQVNFTQGPYWTTSVTPSSTVFIANNPQNIPTSLVTTFDGAGRTTASITNSYGTEQFRTSYAYPFTNETDTNPPTGGTPTSVYTNSAGQKTKLFQYQAASVSTTAPTDATTYAYDARGNMASMTDQAGNAWTWTYDVLNHQTSATDPDAGTTSTSYDAAGNLLTSTDARGRQLSYTYDALNRKLAEYAGSTAGSLLAAWTYDTVANANGQLASSTSYQGSVPGTPGAAYKTTVNGYDKAYKPTGTTLSIPVGAPAFAGTSYTTSNIYNRDESLAAEILPAEGGLASETLHFTYNTTAQLSGLHGSTSYGAVSFTGIGQTAQIQKGTSVLDTTSFGYDAATGAVTGIQETEYNGTAYSTPATLTYGRDNTGNVTSLKNAGITTTDTQCFNYDYLKNLTQAWTPTDGNCTTAASASNIGGPAPYWESFNIDDATGNRTQEIQHGTSTSAPSTTSTYSYPAAGAAQPHAVTSVTSTGATNSTSNYTYDAAGNTATRPGQTLTYEATGKLASDTVSSHTQTNIYDPSGNLLVQTDPTTGSTLFVGETQLHVAAGATTASAVRDYSISGQLVAERTTQAGITGSVLNFVGTDANGTPYIEINSATAAAAERYFDPYGNTRGTSVVWSSSNNYLNAPQSATTGLSIVGARAYDPTVGKFLSVDSILAPDNPMQNNGYAYALNSPITQADPSGNEPTNPDCTTVECRNGYYGAPSNGDGTDISNAPAAAGNSGSQSGGKQEAGGSGDANLVNPPTNANQFYSFYTQSPLPDKFKSGPVDWPGLTNALVAGGTAVAILGCAVATEGICSAFLVEEGGVVTEVSSEESVAEISALLQEHTDAAVARFDAGEISLSDSQIAAAKENGNLYEMFRGDVLDSEIKNTVARDPRLPDLWISRRGEFGPDFHDVNTNTWWDITTPKQFQAHLDKYNFPFGQGIGLFTK